VQREKLGESSRVLATERWGAHGGWTDAPNGTSWEILAASRWWCTMHRAPVFRPLQRVQVVLTSTSRIETALSAEVTSDANVSSQNEPVVAQEASTRRSTEGVAQLTGVHPDTGAPPSTLVYFGAATSSQPGARREAEPDGRDPSCADNEVDQFVLPPSGSSGHGSFLDWASDGSSCFSDYSAVPGGQLALLDDVPFLSNLHQATPPAALRAAAQRTKTSPSPPLATNWGTAGAQPCITTAPASYLPTTWGGVAMASRSNTKTHPSSTTLTLASPARRLPTAVKRPATPAVRTPAMTTSSAVLPSRFFGYFQAI